jgi:hypothetical protein
MTLIRGQIDLPETSGAAFLPGDRLLLVTDEGNGVVLIKKAVSRLRSGRIALEEGELLTPALKGKVDLDDLEDAAPDGAGGVYLLASHGRTRHGDSPEARYRLARLRFDPGGRLLEAHQSDALLQALVNEVPFLADSIRRTPARAGLNIEGLGWAPEGHLLVGLRSPTVTESEKRLHEGQEDAVIVRIKNPEAIFEDPPQAAALGDVVKLDLRGQGIRGMCCDPGRKGCWLISGLSADPNHPVKSPWLLWFWDGTNPPQEARLPGPVDLETPEAVCPLDLDGRPYLLLIEDGKPASRYVLTPAPPLVK